MKRNFKLLVAVVVLVAMVMTLASCEFVNGIWDKINPKPHEHAFSEDWSSDETNHWHAATCTDTEECASQKKDVAEHTFADGKCTVCQAVDPNYDAPCAQHTFTVETTKAPTCTEAGEKTLTCTACGHTEKQTVAALDHTEEPLKGKAPTCTEAGLSEGKKCTECGITITEQTTINALSHDYAGGQFCVRENCGAENPDYTGPKTYVLDVQTLTGFTAGTKADGESEKVGDFFTIYYSAKTKIDTTSKKTWDNYEIGADSLRLNWQSSTSIATDMVKNAIEFTVDGTATVKVWWICGGYVKVDDVETTDVRQIAIYDAEGNIVTSSAISADTHTASGTDGFKNDLFYSEFTISDPGKYYLGNPSGSNYYFKVEVVVTPVEVNEFPVETTVTDEWADEYTFTAPVSGTYTITLPAGLGLFTKASYDAWGNAEVDYKSDYYTGEATDFVVYLTAGTEVPFYVGAKTVGNWTITWTVVEGDPIPDGSQDLPFKWETLPETLPVDADKYGTTYYTFTATATGTITFTWSAGSPSFTYCVLGEDGLPVGDFVNQYQQSEYKLAVEAGKTYVVGLACFFYGPVTDEAVVTISLTACDHVWSNATCMDLATCEKCDCTIGDYAECTPNAETATCDNPIECSVCDSVLERVEHTWDESKTVTVPGDCATMTNGSRTETCSVCDYKEEFTIYVDHEMVPDVNVVETCTTAGEYKAHCANCSYTEERDIPAAGHYAFIACGESGVCEICEETFTKEHAMYTWVEVEATCESDGLIKGWCTSCNTYDVEPYTEVISATGVHTYDETTHICTGCDKVDPDYYFPMSITEAIAAADGNKVQVSGTVTEVKYRWSDDNMSVTISDADGNTLYIYKLATRVGLGDVITIKGTVGSHNGSKQIAAGATATIDTVGAHTEMSIADALVAPLYTKVIVTGIVAKIDTAYSSEYNNITVTLADGLGNTLYVFRLAGGSDLAVHDKITVTGYIDLYSGAAQIGSGATYAVLTTGTGHAYNLFDNKCDFCGAITEHTCADANADSKCDACGETIVAANMEETTYEFKTYAAGTQYAKDEVHVLDSNVTVTTTEAHFTSELRIYSSSTHNGFAIVESKRVIHSVVLNVGNKKDTLLVYGSTDGTNWVEIGSLDVVATYADYTVEIEDSTYKFLKLDVKGTNQLRVQSMTLTTDK